MKASDFTTIAYQTVAFTPGGFPKLGLLTKGLLERFGGDFPGDPVSLPIPENAPREIPRLIMKNGDGTRTLQISPARVDVVLQPPIGFSLQTGDPLALDILEYLESQFHTRYGRLSLIVTRFYEVANPGIVLASHFCKARWVSSKALDRSQAFEIHAYRRYRVSDEVPQVNSWIRHKAGEHMLFGINPATGIILEQDLNTPQELETSDNYFADRRLSFFNSIGIEADAILSIYYPEG
jgi:hypothetical protein